VNQELQSLFAGHIDQIRRRTERALEAAGLEEVLILAGSPPLQFADDQPYPFRPNPQFRLWVPEPEAGSVVSFRPGQRPRLLFVQTRDFWHQPPRLPAATWAQHFDVEVFHDEQALRDAVAPQGRRALLGARDPAWDGRGEWNPASLLGPLDYARAAKTPYEIECLARANLRGAAAHRAAERAFRDGASEYEVHLAYCRAASVREEELPYNNIIAFGDHGAILHYQNLDRDRPAGTKSLLIDAGAPYAGYGSDITRTHAAGPGTFADLVIAVERAQQRLAAAVRVGRDWRDFHLESHRELGSVLAEAGIVRATAEEAVERGLTRLFFPHGIGHLLGLQVHDVGGTMAGPDGGERPRPAGHPWLRLTRELEPGWVVTVEPGIYFIDALLAEAAGDGRRRLIHWDAVEALKGCGGIRIEDDVIALPDEPRNLTREAFSQAG